MAKKKAPDPRAALLKPLTVNEAKKAEDGRLPDVPEFHEAFPVLNAMLTVAEVDGVKRQPATITLWVEDHGIKAVLNDRAAKRKLWAVSPSIGGLWGELEAALEAKDPDWRSEAGTRTRRR